MALHKVHLRFDNIIATRFFDLKAWKALTDIRTFSQQKLILKVK